MIFPQAMSEIELVVPNKDAVAVTRALGGLGSFHQVDSSYLTSSVAAAGVHPWQEKASALNALERRLQALMNNLGVRGNGAESGSFADGLDLETVTREVEQP